jgi:protein-tyrosine phosphatase
MDEFDKIYVMDEQNYRDVKRIAAEKWNENKVHLLLNEAYPAQNKNVPDPYQGVESDYHSVYEMIELACEKIIAKAIIQTAVQ